MITAHISKAKNGKGLWLIVDRNTIFKEFDNLSDGQAYPITEDEIEAIRDACNSWLDSNHD